MDILNENDLDKLPDEELLRLYKSGYQRARDVLSVRYFQMRFSLLSRFNLEQSCFQDEWELNEAYFVAYLKTEANFVSGKGTKFLTLMCRNLANEIAAIYNRAKKQIESASIISLDEPCLFDPRTDDDERINADIFTDSLLDEVKSYVDYSAIINYLFAHLDTLGYVPKKLITCLYAGVSFQEACKRCHISKAKGRVILGRVKTLLNEYSQSEDEAVAAVIELEEQPLELVRPLYYPKAKSKRSRAALRRPREEKIKQRGRTIFASKPKRKFFQKRLSSKGSEASGAGKK